MVACSCLAVVGSGESEGRIAPCGGSCSMCAVRPGIPAAVGGGTLGRRRGLQRPASTQRRLATYPASQPPPPSLRPPVGSSLTAVCRLAFKAKKGAFAGQRHVLPQTGNSRMALVAFAAARLLILRGQSSTPRRCMDQYASWLTSTTRAGLPRWFGGIVRLYWQCTAGCSGHVWSHYTEFTPHVKPTGQGCPCAT